MIWKESQRLHARGEKHLNIPLSEDGVSSSHKDKIHQLVLPNASIVSALIGGKMENRIEKLFYMSRNEGGSILLKPLCFCLKDSQILIVDGL